jgi:hypothetical protein
MTRLVNIVLASALITLGLTSCVDVKSISYESFYCSVDRDESPLYTCDGSQKNLVCIQTYTLGEKMQKVNLCRVTCQSRAECPNLGDVCCAGPIAGETYGKSKACVPKDLCQTDPAALLEPAPTLRSDAGTNDTGSVPSGNDGSADVSLEPDAPIMSLVDSGVDAISTDSGSDL